jgi:Ca2+-dependent lipid-binding protein
MEIMEIPLLKSWIHSVVMSGILEALVDPGKLVIDLKGDSSSLVISAKAPPKTRGM